MPSNAYYQWVAAGKPLTPALCIRETVDQLKLAFPKAAEKNLFSWYANESHYQAVPPQDHTPFSATGWPGTSPRWYVFATDIMDRPDLGVDCDVLFTYWIAEARAGRMPWMKYFIWQAKIYDVRNQWKPTPSSGHFDHVHMSTRTDYVNIGLGSWSIVPGGVSMLVRVTESGAIWTVDPSRLWRRYIGPEELPTWSGVGTVAVHQSDLDAGWYGVDIDSFPSGDGGSDGGGLAPHVHVLPVGETGGAVASSK